MDEIFKKAYEPKEHEGVIYKIWEESGFFNPEKMIGAGLTHEKAVAYTIIMPPPNVTGILHMGHALMLTLEDILIRYHRMLGERTLWLPGTDHAAIATQARVEKDIYKTEEKSRYDLGREELLRRIDVFAKASHDTITSQIRVMGASCDWSREAFTLDEKRNFAVNTAFKKMYDEGLIFRGLRVINWDPKGQTTISDDEIVYEEREATLYTFKYACDFPIPVSTTRLETKIGDTAVAVHPDDKRYQDFIGKEYKVSFCGEELNLKIIADREVDPNFGTGALGVTPAHSQIDALMAEKNHLPMVQVINEKARMISKNELLNGKKVLEAREIIANWLREQKLLIKEEKIKQNVATAERTGGIVEPLPKKQWFVDVEREFERAGKKTSLKQIMKVAVESGAIAILPEHFSKIYFHWIDNLKPWCISRQIWYGHRIPVWYNEAGEVVSVGDFNKEDSRFHGNDKINQDPDTLDTWFSSALWTFSTLGWPKKTAELEIYHPTSLLETGYEILFFWVARMILMSGYFLDEVPFKKVLLHGTVRDAKGRKMSKSLGNGIDPIEIAEKYGADAARMALVTAAAPGTDIKIEENKIKGYKHYTNKLWNITRFILDNTEASNFAKLNEEVVATTEADKKILEEFEKAKAKITQSLNDLEIHLAALEAYRVTWNELADFYIEASKKQLEDPGIKTHTQKLLAHLLVQALKLNHPFIPFVTEKIYQSLPHKNKPLLMVETW